jgi:hypothetical protein
MTNSIFFNRVSVIAVGLVVSGVAALDAQPRRTTKAEAESTYENIPQVAKINERIRAVWQEYDLQGSPKASDGEWCRRVFLDILGRIPSVDELNAYIQNSDPDKRLKLINSLLYDEKYTEEYARNWTTLWTNILIGRTGGNDDDAMTNREGMQKYLRDSFARNKPYNQMVYELVTATGRAAPGTDDFNGAVNFLIDKVNEENATLATADTTKILLGLQVQCTQCHNHPFNEWKQQKFWEVNAFFRQARADAGVLLNRSFPGEGTDPEEAELYYELRNGLLKVAYPVFVDGTEVGKSGFLEDVDRRTEFGKLMVKSPYMDKTMVNRTWAHFLGYGFTKPIDDLGPHNPPSHPALLDYLAGEFRKNSFDVKELIKWITLSESYSLSSKMTASNKIDDPLLGEPPKFSHFYLRQMRAEELYESLLVATQAEKTQGNYEEQEKSKTQWLQQFVTAFGTDEGGETTSFNGTIPQVLMMFNGDLIKRATSTNKGSLLWKVNNSKMKPREKIDYLFLAGTGRKPNKNELGIANQLLLARKGDTSAALQDIWWVVLNSNQFIFNH